jgi:hypothetical protein
MGGGRHRRAANDHARADEAFARGLPPSSGAADQLDGPAPETGGMGVKHSPGSVATLPGGTADPERGPRFSSRRLVRQARLRDNLRDSPFSLAEIAE